MRNIKIIENRDVNIQSAEECLRSLFVPFAQRNNFTVIKKHKILGNICTSAGTENTDFYFFLKIISIKVHTFSLTKPEK